MQAVTPATCDDYYKRLLRFMMWLRDVALDPETDEEIDEALADFFDMQYAAGESSPEASKLLAAIGHYWPRFSRHGAGSLPRAARAAKGFQRMAPSRSRPPLPWLALMRMMGSSMHAGQFPFAFSC